LAKLDQLVPTDSPDLQDPRGPLEIPAQKVRQDQQDPMDQTDPLVHQVQQALLGKQVQLDRMATLDL